MNDYFYCLSALICLGMPEHEALPLILDLDSENNQ